MLRGQSFAKNRGCEMNVEKFCRRLLCVQLAIFAGVALVIVLLVATLGVGVWYMTSPTTYNFENGAKLVVPWGAVSVDQREKGNGIVVQSGVNVTVDNQSDEWRTLTVSYRKPNYGILDTHAFVDLSPKSSKTFGAEPSRYEGMHVSVSDYGQKKCEKGAKTGI